MSQVPPIVIDVTVDRMRQTLRHHVTDMLDPEKVKAAIDRAFAGFDVYAEIEKMARAALNDVVVTQASDIAWPVREAIRKAAEERVRELVAPLVAGVADSASKPASARSKKEQRR